MTPTDAQTMVRKRHEAAYETPRPSTREVAQKGAGRGQHTRSQLDYDEVEGIRYSSITESLVNECLCSSDGWLALVPVEVIASAPEVELSLMGGEEETPPMGLGSPRQCTPRR